VNTEIIEKIPIVMPKSERNVLNLLTITELKAKIKPSFKSLKNILLFLDSINEDQRYENHLTLIIIYYNV
jgi:hypothetical protein